ncbi:hypothetical protein BYT27DRAFT_7094277 [Phlegmacium glaucopus]|nr:hypothetical protein BYT27DRAFT_7094277 [Phlegmacium glaucopus]
MPQVLKCFCDSTGCAGHEVSKCVFDAHSRLDRAAQARTYQAASERVLKNQDEALSTHLSAMTLSDKVSGISQHPGGRFWSKSSAEESTERTSPQCCEGVTLHELTDHNLQLLRDIKKSLDKLQADAKRQLATVGVPLARDTPFPLKPLIVAVLDIQNQLVGIKQRIALVDEMKASISSKVQDLLTILRCSQRQWIDMAKQCSQEPVSKSSTDSNAGMFS